MARLQRMIAYLGLSTLVLVTMLVALAAPAAADVSSVSVTVGTPYLGADSSYQVDFNSPSTLTTGDTITLTFPAGFDLTGVINNDLLISNAGADYFGLNWVQSGASLTWTIPHVPAPNTITMTGTIRLTISHHVINTTTQASNYTVQVATSKDPTPVSSPAFSIDPDPFVKLQVLMPGETAAPGTPSGKTGSPITQTAGTPFSVTVNAVDANWNLVNSVTKTVSLSSGDGQADLGAAAALTSGTGTFSVTLKTAGTQTVTATSGAVTGTGSGTTVSAAAADSLTVTGEQNIVAGGSFSLTITAKDPYGNVDDSYTGDQNLIFLGPSPSPSPYNTEPTVRDKNNTHVNFGTTTTVTFNSGVATAVVKAYRAATGESVLVLAGSLSGTSGPFDVTPTAVASLFIWGEYDITVGSNNSLQIIAKDLYGNTNGSGSNDYDGDRSLTFSGLATSPNGTNPTALDKSSQGVDFNSATTVTFNHGVANTWIQPYNAANNQRVTVTEGALYGTTGPFDVLVGPVHHFGVTGDSDQVAGGSFTLTLTAQDRGGNTNTGYTGDKVMRFSGLSAAPSGNAPMAQDKSNVMVPFGPDTTVSFTGGVGTSLVQVYKTGTNQAVTVTDAATTKTGTSGPFTVTPETAAALTVTGEPLTMVAGGSVTLTVTAQDLYGNVNDSGVNGWVSTKVLTFSSLPESPNHTLPTAEDNNHQHVAFGLATPVDFAGGVGTSLVKTYGAGTFVGVRVTAGALTVRTTDFDVTAGPLDHLLVANAANTSAGGSLSLSLVAGDAYGNPVPTYTGPHTLMFSGLTESPNHTKPTARDENGTGIDVNFGTPTVVTFLYGMGSSRVNVYKPGDNQAVTVTDDTPMTATSAPFKVDPGVTTAFTLTPSVPSPVSGAAFSVTVTAFDDYGNVDSEFERDVTLSSTDAGFAPITYSFTLADAGSHTFPVVLGTPGNQTITATSPKKFGAISNSVGITVTGGGGGGGGAVSVPVVASVSVSGPATVLAGQQADFTATGLSATGARVPTNLTWTAAEGAITASGTWTAPTKPGTYTVTAKADNGITGTATVQVTPGPAAKVTVTAASGSVAAGGSAAFSATVTDAYGNTLTGAQVTWSATGGTISSGGVFTADVPASSARVTATVQTAAGQVSGSATIAITGGGTGGSTGGTSSSTGGTGDKGGSTGRNPVVTSDRGTISDSTQPTPAGNTVLTQPVVISGNGTVTATFHVPNAPQDSSTLAYYWDANLKQWIAVPTTFGPDGPVAQVPAGVPVSLMQGSVKQPSDTITSWANRYVLKAASLGLVSGMPDGTFHPDEPMTRYQMATVLALAAGLDVGHADLSVLKGLSDADQIPDWARPYVAAALSSGLMIGDGEGFSGDLPLTRAQMASLLGRLLPGAASASLTFTDTDSIPSWARDGVARAVAAGIIKGMEDGAFRPDEPLTRAQMATEMALYLDYAASHR